MQAHVHFEKGQSRTEPIDVHKLYPLYLVKIQLNRACNKGKDCTRPPVKALHMYASKAMLAAKCGTSAAPAHDDSCI